MLCGRAWLRLSVAAMCISVVTLGLTETATAATVSARLGRAEAGQIDDPGRIVNACPTDAPTCLVEALKSTGSAGYGKLEYSESWSSGQIVGTTATAQAFAPEAPGFDGPHSYGRGFYELRFTTEEPSDFTIDFALQLDGNYDSSAGAVQLSNLGTATTVFRRMQRGSTTSPDVGAPQGVIPPGRYSFVVTAGAGTYALRTAPSSALVTGTLTLEPEQCTAGTARVFEGDALAVASTLCDGPAFIGTVDGQTAVDGGTTPSTLELKSLPAGIACSVLAADSPECTYTWYRSATQSDGNYVASSDGVVPGDERYRLAQNAEDDAGHRFHLEITDGDGNSAVSNAVAVGPSAIPELGHPNLNEEIRVRRPFLNVKNVVHDAHTPANEAGSYTYEFQASADATFPEAGTITFSGPEQADNHDVSYAQTTGDLADGIVHWRARAVAADAPGRWSAARQFTVANVWSDDGHIWHSPLDAATSVSGTHNEPYFHTGYLGTQLHGGLDLAACGVPVRAARSGLLSRLAAGGAATVSLLHPAAARQTQYLHMSAIVTAATLPLGTFVNQGTRLGTASDTGIAGSCHLHFDVADTTTPNPVRYFNPLDVLPAASWTNAGDPTVGLILFRSVEDDTTALIEHGGGQNPDTTEIAGNVYLIAGTNDPNPVQAPGQNLAPEEVQFWINGALSHTIDLGMDLTADKHERNYFARRSVSSRAPTASAGAVYFPYYKWNTASLGAAAGPQTIEVRAFDHAGNSGSRTLTIGPSIVEPAVVCGSEPQIVTVRVENRNNNIEGLSGVYRGNGDRYHLEVAGNWITASVQGPRRLTVGGGGTGEVRIRVGPVAAEAPPASFTLRVRSGILTDVSDELTVNVLSVCP